MRRKAETPSNPLLPTEEKHMLQVRACTEREFQESHQAITAVDAIMDEGVFEHLKKFSSYKYSLYQQRKQQQQQQLQQQHLLLLQQLAQLQLRMQRLQQNGAASIPDPLEQQQQQQQPGDDELQQQQQQQQQLQQQQQQLQQELLQVQQQQQMEVLNEFAAIRRINNEACTLLASNYEGYAWMSQVAARVIELLQLPDEEGGPGGPQGDPLGAPQEEAPEEEAQQQHELLPDTEQLLLGGSSSSSSSRKFEKPTADSILVAALCELLATKYNSHVSRKLLQDKSQHGSWRPPPFYWHLFDHPCIVRQMLQLYHQRPQDEFLACWFEDFALHRRQPGLTPLPPSDSEAVLTNKLLQQSRLTSNFSVFTLRVSEELRRFLLRDEREELFSMNLSNIAALFLHAENAYVYALALLVFVADWRPDLSGSRRLAQLLTRMVVQQGEVAAAAAATTPQRQQQHAAAAATGSAAAAAAAKTDIPHVERQREVSAAQLYLLLTNLDEFPRLAALFRSITRSLFIGVDIHLAPADACDLCDVVEQLLQRFEGMQQLLYERSLPTKAAAPAANSAAAAGAAAATSSSDSSADLSDDPGAAFATPHMLQQQQLQQQQLQLHQQQLQQQGLAPTTVPLQQQYVPGLQQLLPAEELQQQQQQRGSKRRRSKGERDFSDDSSSNSSSSISSSSSSGISCSSSEYSSLRLQQQQPQQRLLQQQHIPHQQQHLSLQQEQQQQQQLGADTPEESVGGDVLEMPSASQYGVSRPWHLEYRRTRGAPVEPPLAALRETALLDSLLEDFVNPRLLLQQKHQTTQRLSSSSSSSSSSGGGEPQFLKYANLLVALCVRSAYELARRWWEGRKQQRLQQQQQQQNNEQQTEHEPWQFDGDPEEMQRSSDEWSSNDSSPADISEAGEQRLDMEDLFEEPEHHLPGASFRTQQQFFEQQQVEDKAALPHALLLQQQQQQQQLFLHQQQQVQLQKHQLLQQQQHQMQQHQLQQHQMQQHQMQLQQPPSTQQLRMPEQPQLYMQQQPLLQGMHQLQQHQLQQHQLQQQQPSHSFQNPLGVLQQPLQVQLQQQPFVPIQQQQADPLLLQQHQQHQLFLQQQQQQQQQQQVTRPQASEEIIDEEGWEKRSDYDTSSLTESSSSSSSSLTSSSITTSLNPSAVGARGWQQQPLQQQQQQQQQQPLWQQQQQPVYMGGGGKAINAYSSFPGTTAAAAAAGGSAAAAADDSCSLLGSEVFKNAIEKTRLGRGAHLSQRQQQKISKHFQLYAKSVESYKAIARKELLEIYRICRREEWPLCVKWNAMLGCIGTSVAASAVLCFVRQQLLGSSSSSAAAAATAEGGDAAADPLLMVTDGLLVLLKLIVDIHRNKRPPVVDLLGRLFVSGGNRGEAPALAERRMERRVCIVRFWLYVCKYEGEFVSVISVFKRVYAHTDRSICRFFLSELLRLCGPPFSSYFCTAVLRLVAQIISTERSAFRGSEAEGRRLRMAVLTFIEQTLRFCDAPSAVPPEVAELAQAVRTRLLSLPQEEDA